MEEVQQQIPVRNDYEAGQIDDALNNDKHLSESVNHYCGTISSEHINHEDLSRVFADFNRVASALDESYLALEQRVHSLKRELSETRLAHHWDQAEKDRLANRLASLVSVLPCAVLVLNKTGLIIDRNPLASQALNEPLIGLSLDSILEREGVSECSPQNEIVLRSGRVFSVARDRLAVSSDRAVFLTDVTDIHTAQQEMARNKRLTEMGEMTASMAHQIRTPLSAAHLYMSSLARTDLDETERNQTVSKIQNRLAEVGKLIDSMLSFVRGSKVAGERVSLQSILNRVRLLVASDLERYEAELFIPSVSNSIYFQADPEAIVGALSNIVLNAFEIIVSQPGQNGTAIKPEVLFEIVAKDKAVEIMIRDNGPGIDADKLERIFDPFYTTRSAGTGLGLAIAAMTFKQHGGDVLARNHGEGGAEFIIRLPLLSEEASGLIEEQARLEASDKHSQTEVA